MTGRSATGGISLVAGRRGALRYVANQFGCDLGRPPPATIYLLRREDHLNMPYTRRALLRTGTAAIGSLAVVGAGTAAEQWSYSPVSVAPVAGVTDCALQDGWAYAANFRGITTYDLSDPSSPAPGGFAPGNFSSQDNRDVKVDGDLAGIADNRETPGGGVTFYDVSDPSSPAEVSFYDAETDVHNHFIHGEYAYLVQDDGMGVVDVSDPSEPTGVGRWRLRDFRPQLAEDTADNLHDIYVQDDYCYLAYWDAGTVVLDATDPTDLRPVAHFGAYDGEDGAEGGNPQNVHYVQPTPDRAYTIAGAETFFSTPHGGTAIYHTPTLADYEPDKLDSIVPLAGDVDGETGGANQRTKKSRADAFYPRPIDFVRAPSNTQDQVRTAHNSDLTNDKLFTAWYQGGIRAYDFGSIRAQDGEGGELAEIAAWDPEGGDFFWSAENLAAAMDADADRYYTVGSDTGKGLHVLELSHADGGSVL